MSLCEFHLGFRVEICGDVQSLDSNGPIGPILLETFTEQSHCWWQIEKTSCWNRGTRVWGKVIVTGKKNSSHFSCDSCDTCTLESSSFRMPLAPIFCFYNEPYLHQSILKGRDLSCSGQPFVNSGQPRQQRQQLLRQETYPALEASSRLQRPLALRLEPCDIPIFQTRINKCLIVFMFFVQNALTET